MSNEKQNGDARSGELVSSAQGGELPAFEALVGRYERRVYTLALRILGDAHEAEDVTQQTFLGMLRHLEGFRGEAGFATWILRIATNNALKVVRKRKGLATTSLEQATEPREEDGAIPHPEFIADWRENPAALAERRETREVIEQALRELDEPHRAVFILRDVEGFSVKETAAALGLSEANVKVRLLRARLRLRERLTRQFGDPARALSAGAHGRGE